MLWQVRQGLIAGRGALDASSAPWTPATLGANLIAWYKADTGVFVDAGSTSATNGQTVQQWNDQSGNNYHLKQATGAARPTYQSAGFNGQKTILLGPSSSVNTFMVTTADTVALGAVTTASGFMVGQMLTDADNFAGGFSYLGNGQAGGQDNTASAEFVIRQGTGNAVQAYRNNGALSSAAVSLATNYRMGSIYDGTNNTFYLNNAAQTPVASTSSFTSPGAILVGALTSSPILFWSGPISEIVLTNSALSSGDRLSLDDYFKAKWGL